MKIAQDPFSTLGITLIGGNEDLPVGLTPKSDDYLVEPRRLSLGTDGILSNTLEEQLGPHHLSLSGALY